MVRGQSWLLGKLLVGRYSNPQQSEPCPGFSIMRRQRVRDVCHLYITAISHALINAYLFNNKPASQKETSFLLMKLSIILRIVSL